MLQPQPEHGISDGTGTVKEEQKAGGGDKKRQMSHLEKLEFCFWIEFEIKVIK